SHQRHRIHASTFSVAEETDGTKWNASVLNPLEGFFERVHNEPEHAAYFAKKIAREMADSLSNQNGWRFSVRHGGEVASVSHWEKSKVCCRLGSSPVTSDFAVTARAVAASLDRGGPLRAKSRGWPRSAHPATSVWQSGSCFCVKPFDI